MKLREVLSQGSPGSRRSSALETGTYFSESKGNFTSGNLLSRFNYTKAGLLAATNPNKPKSTQKKYHKDCRKRIN